MGEIATSNREITLFYSSNSERAKHALAYAKTEGLAIHEVDILRTKLTGYQITELEDRLHMKGADLVNQEYATYTSHFEHHNFSINDWIKMIQYNPEIMKQPIALKGATTFLVVTP